MNYQKSTCSRELAERMAELGICQDGAELWWLKHPINETWDLFTGNPLQEHKFIAPTLSRMLEELPILYSAVQLLLAKEDGGWNRVWMVQDDEEGEEVSQDKDLCNAVAKALIKLKEDGE